MEEPIPLDAAEDGYDREVNSEGVTVLTPRLATTKGGCPNERLRVIVNRIFSDFKIEEFIAWYYTPMALPFTRHLTPQITVFDAMDELSAFKFAPAELKALEGELMERTDVVFTGGESLYQAKKHRHHNIHAFPSSIDKTHFAVARTAVSEPDDQKNIPHPRLGFYGVVDERFDIEMLGKMAALRPDWHFIIIGPIVKIDPESLPQSRNIHYLGGKKYNQLPTYLAGWDIALMPFALNESTRFISPTKTPEYLAGGKPVIATAIHDVIYPYGEEGLVSIIHTGEEAIEEAERLMRQNKGLWQERVDQFLENISWEDTWSAMNDLILQTLKEKTGAKTCTTILS